MQNEINDLSRRIQECEDADCWDLPAKVQIPGLACERTGIEIAKDVADGVLWAAKAVLEAEDYIACKSLTEAASVALDVAQAAAHEAIDIAQGALKATGEITNGLVAAANAALEGAGTLGQAAVDLASVALKEAQKASLAVLAGAQATLDGLKSCGEWLAYKAAGSGAMLLAEAGVKVADAVSQVAMRAWQFVLSGIVSFVNLTDVVLTAELSKAVRGFAFSADIKGTIGDDNFFQLQVEFDTKKILEFIKAVFDK